MNEAEEKIVENFSSNQGIYQDFCHKVEAVLLELLVERALPYHQVSKRIKSISSLTKKIEGKPDKYKVVAEITDLVGLRVIVYLENDVDDIAQLIREEFKIDEPNTIDKRKLAVDTFGYKSLHYVVSLDENRCALTENKRFSGLKAEIQIRSILQHAWAEIEHDLGYKSEKEIPEQHKRSFHRIAALLETADLGFVELKKNLDVYRNAVPLDIKNQPENVLIDKTSLDTYIDESPVVRRIDNAIADQIGAMVDDDRKYTGILVNNVLYLGIVSIKELDLLLIQNEQWIISFAINWLKENRIVKFNYGICIFYLCYVLVAQKGKKMIEKYAVACGIVIQKQEHEFALRVLNTFHQIEKK